MEVSGQLHASLALFPGTERGNPFYRRLGVHQNLSGHSGDEKNPVPVGNRSSDPNPFWSRKLLTDLLSERNLTTWFLIFFEHLIVAQLSKKFPAVFEPEDSSKITNPKLVPE
jgi:hypothetical protein